MNTTELVRDIVEDYFHLPSGTLNIKSRKREIVIPRQLAHYFACCERDKLQKLHYSGEKVELITFDQIGKIIGNKKHCDVMYSAAVVKNGISEVNGKIVDPELCKIVARLKLKIDKGLTRLNVKVKMAKDRRIRYHYRAMFKRSFCLLRLKIESEMSKDV